MTNNTTTLGGVAWREEDGPAKFPMGIGLFADGILPTD